ncbi:MAG TPA: DUF6785 family protein, partial [Armatimonadota bacterium]|nr:DUF6785 family protein [Armatimonadota bacterium]
QFLVTSLVNPFWFATPENKWADFHPFIASWLVPSKNASDLAGFFMGNAAVPWGMWLRPALVWGSFLFALMLSLLCLNVLLRRQWVERERLNFPIVQVPLAVTENGGSGPFYRNRLLWLGFAIPVILETINSLNYIYPNIPYIQIKPFNVGQFIQTRPWNAVGAFNIAFYPLVIGIAFLISLDVSFSCWFFYLLSKMEEILSVALGFRDPGASLAMSRIPYIGEQGAGAFLAIALFALWSSRHYLHAAFTRAWTGTKGADDSDEPVSYRTAFLGLIGGMLYVVVFSALAGMPWYLGVIFFTIFALYMVTLTRIRAEAGTPWHSGAGMNAHDLMTRTLGTGGMNPQSLTGFGMFQWMDFDYRCAIMPHQLEGMKIAQVARMNTRHLFYAILLAVVVGVAGTFWSMLDIYYHYGAATAKVNTWRTSMGSQPYNILSGWLNNVRQPDASSIQAIGVGSLIAVALSMLRARFVWWPFHPIGYAIANSGALTWLWCPILVGWLCKQVIVRYGGIRLYRQALPFFIGLILGDYIIGSVWAIIGLLLKIPVYRCFPI